MGIFLFVEVWHIIGADAMNGQRQKLKKHPENAGESVA